MLHRARYRNHVHGSQREGRHPRGDLLLVLEIGGAADDEGAVLEIGSGSKVAMKGEEEGEGPGQGNTGSGDRALLEGKGR